MNSHLNSEHFYVITGGPGSGKTSLIDALAARGYQRSFEAGRALIQQQVAVAGRALPWADRLLFSELMLSWEIRSYQMAEKIPGLVFFDRGVPDVEGYLRLLKVPVPEHIRKAAEIFRYNRRVFLAPPWPKSIPKTWNASRIPMRRSGLMRPYATPTSIRLRNSRTSARNCDRTCPLCPCSNAPSRHARISIAT